MDVRLVTDAGVEHHPVEALDDLLRRDDGFVWVDVPTCDEAAMRVLSDVFKLHPRAVRDCLERNRVPKMHAYAEHVFIVLHTPEQGQGGHVHYIELDQFAGPRYLVTVHGPVNPAVDPAVALKETQAVLERLESRRLRPSSALELSHAIVSALARRQEEFVEVLTGDVWSLEQRVTGGHLGNPEQFLEELFRVRHGLLVVRTMGALSREVYGRMAAVTRAISPEAQPLVQDIADQFDQVRAVADGQREYLQGVIEFYQTRTETKMTVAAERLAVVAVVTLPITALSSVYGMNIIVNNETDFPHLVVVLAVVVAMSVLLLGWARRQGWW